VAYIMIRTRHAAIRPRRERSRACTGRILEHAASAPRHPRSEEHVEVAGLPARLPAERPAREAYARGARTIELTHLVADRPEFLEAPMEIFRAGYRRLRARSGGLRPH